MLRDEYIDVDWVSTLPRSIGGSTSPAAPTTLVRASAEASATACYLGERGISGLARSAEHELPARWPVPADHHYGLVHRSRSDRAGSGAAGQGRGDGPGRPAARPQVPRAKRSPVGLPRGASSVGDEAHQPVRITDARAGSHLPAAAEWRAPRQAARAVPVPDERGRPRASSERRGNDPAERAPPSARTPRSRCSTNSWPRCAARLRIQKSTCLGATRSASTRRRESLSAASRKSLVD
jgi:hypothetical protein